MNESSVPVIVLTSRREDVEFFNKTMRDAGHAVRCRGMSRLKDFEEILGALQPHLIVFFADRHNANLREIAKLRQLHARMAPLIVIQDSVDEAAIGKAMRAGAQDLVSVGQKDRLLAVCERELRSFRLERALNDTLSSATRYKKQLKAFMLGSMDAIAEIQEGIVVEANQAWADIFADGNVDGALGPLMDYVAEGAQAALKGALVACAKQQWDGEFLKIDALAADGSRVPVEIKLDRSSFDGEAAVRLSILRRLEQESAPTPSVLVEKVLQTDPVTGFFLRQQFLELLTDKLDHRSPGGARALAWIRPDKFGEIAQAVGPVSSEEILAQLAGLIGRLLSSNDIAGRIGGNIFACVLERGSLRDIQAWAENALNRIAENIFEVADRSLSLTCSIGLAELGEGTDRVEELIRNAEKAYQQGRGQGGNRVAIEETADKSTRIKRIDALWVRQIKSALVEGRFRLVNLNISSLSGQSERFLDTVVRMIDEQGDEIAASDFIGTARRNKLLRPIDRWVIDASLNLCKKEAADLVFVKLSHESILDPSLCDWLFSQVQSCKVNPQNICFQISEEDASQYQKQTVALAQMLRRHRFRFAIEHFGTGRDPLRVLMNTPMDFVKFDGSLMQTVAHDPGIQEKIRAYVSSARRHEIQTIAARVENANTMAVLFQLGVEYMQGHYLHEPEVVLEEVV